MCVKEDMKSWDTAWVHGEPVRKEQEERVRCGISILQIALS